jgi:predicted enzyme related to lactoylglutathione lyase
VNAKELAMSRLQLALNVSDLEEAITFYSKLFQTGPAKVRPGYANFAVDQPPLKLVLIEGVGEPGSVNHLGVEVASADDVVAATTRLTSSGLQTDIEERTTCCYALQDKVWVDGPDGARWEVYAVLADDDDWNTAVGKQGCCTSSSVEPTAASVAQLGCC